MTEEQIALARRAVACKGWKWMPGMLACDATFIRHRIQDDGSALDLSDDILNRAWGYSPNTLRPILTDPATLGCLLALVREAHGSPKIRFEGQTYASVLYVVCGSGNYYIRRDCGDGEEALYVDGVWSANVRHGVDEVSCDTEADALVAALEAAQ